MLAVDNRLDSAARAISQTALTGVIWPVMFT